jgi:hypothetical protein
MKSKLGGKALKKNNYFEFPEKIISTASIGIVGKVSDLAYRLKNLIRTGKEGHLPCHRPPQPGYSICLIVSQAAARAGV